ncbi:hypothetical protein FRB90_003526 [Tulasnella sp. 427]|nr:hypothetical protein FRB90_003526 [Tulasnella sp. 427]
MFYNPPPNFPLTPYISSALGPGLVPKPPRQTIILPSSDVILPPLILPLRVQPHHHEYFASVQTLGTDARRANVRQGGQNPNGATSPPTGERHMETRRAQVAMHSERKRHTSGVAKSAIIGPSKRRASTAPKITTRKVWTYDHVYYARQSVVYWWQQIGSRRYPASLRSRIIIPEHDTTPTATVDWNFMFEDFEARANGSGKRRSL